MKIIKDFRKELPSKAICWYCSKMDYIINTPMGGSYITCPICRQYVDFEDDERYDKYDELLDNCVNEGLLKYYYCHKCNILFDMEIHGANGCTEDSYTSIFIYRFKWNGIIYEGMPQINVEELFSILKNDIQFEILEKVSTNTLPVPIRYCSGAVYPTGNGNKPYYYSEYENDKKRFGEVNDNRYKKYLKNK